VKESWEKMKSKKRESLADGLPGGLPSLHRAYRLQDRAAGVGFDWNDIDGPLEKVEEELEEIHEHLREHPPMLQPSGAPLMDDAHSALEGELGDLLFSVVNLCRKAGVHPSLALDKTNAKFERRFKTVERLARERGLKLESAGLEKLDALWDEAKLEEKNSTEKG
jgi:ATP diphosphatase